jgi:hypothetical protein
MSKKINQQETEDQALKAFSKNNFTPNGAYRGQGRGRGRGRGGRYIVGINNNIISIKRVNFKEEAEDMAATTQQLIGQSQQTSPMLNVIKVIGMAIISQNVKLI